MTFCSKKTLLLLCFVIYFPILVASDYQAQKEALNIIGDFAVRICNKVSSMAI